ncbi:hypothetical protein PG988_012818 [Apiospora saccharicola]
MAEILGAVASGISIAQFAGSIIKTGLRIKSLLEDIRDVPEDLQRHLGQIQLLAPLLAEINHGPSLSNGALFAAAEQCRQAALELDVLATELSSQVQSSQGFNRRFRSFQAVIQKGTLARHEKRMQGSMQMLVLALQLTSLCRQNELIQLQQSQSGIIAAEVVGSLDLARRADQSLGTEHGTGTETHGPRKRCQKTSGTDIVGINRLSLFRPTTTVGFERLTGSVQFQTLNHATTAEYKTGRADETISYRFRLRFPRWLSDRALELFLHNNSISWNCTIIPYSVRELSSDIGKQIHQLLEEDDMQGLKISLQRGDIAIRGRFIQDHTRWTHEKGNLHKITKRAEQSLFSLAIQTGAWKVGNYLEELGIAHNVRSITSSAWNNDNDSAYYRRNLLHKLDETFLIEASLSSFNGTFHEFQVLRETFWPDSQFFHESSTETRLSLARRVIEERAYGFTDHALQTEKIRHVLLGQGTVSDVHNTRHLQQEVFGGIVRLIGQASFEGDASVISIWTELWMELADAYLPSIHYGFFPDNPGQLYEVLRNHPFTGWLSMLLQGVRRGLVKHSPDRSTGNRGQTCLRFNKAMNEAMRVYLDMLQARGVDLALVYEVEMPVWKAFVGVTFIDTGYLTFCYIGITHGPNPEDWQFFSADNTESYAREFWELVDPAPLWIPGSWVDNDMD